MRTARIRVLAAAVAVTAAGVLAAPTAAAAPADPAAQPAIEAAGACPTPDPATPKRQLRAEWLASVVNIDWPSRPGLPREQIEAEYHRWLDEAVDRSMNAVVVQIRPTADAFWPSPFEPWSQYLSSAQGVDPGWDPLAFAVREAHARNLEFHAWFNPYRVSMQADPAQLSPQHPGRVNPDWILPYGGKLYYDPGKPEVRAHVEDAIMHAVENYDVDAVHFDDYFYPYPVAGQVFDDEATYQEHGAAEFPDKRDWRRANVDTLIRELDERIDATKPWVKFGISPFAVWRNGSTDPEGTDTQAGVQTYDDLYADTRKWVREEWIDYIAPQVYWHIGFTVADYAKIVPWWANEVRGRDVQLVIGQATYKQGAAGQPAPWFDPAEMSRHLTFNRAYPEVVGDMYFSAKDVRANRVGHMDWPKAGRFSRPAIVPPAADGSGRAPHPPVITSARRTAAGVDVRWVSHGATSFAIWRLDGTVWPRACDLADAKRLVATVRAGGGVQHAFTDPTAVAGQRYTYVVTALDRLYTESRPGTPGYVLR